MKTRNNSYIGVSFIILIFGIIFIPKIVDRIQNNDIVRSDSRSAKIDNLITDSEPLPFLEINGVRYSLPGDYAQVEEGGTISLLGRGSVCINTAGEKVFPEEVEEVVKKHDSVVDCLVVGIPDDQYGQQVIAVISLEEDVTHEESLLKDFTKNHLTGYKVPKGFVCVVQVRRGPNGQGDYKWAKETAIKYYS